MIYKAKENQMLFMCSMGKKLRVTAIADNDAEANKHMEKSGFNEGVIATFGPFVILASLYDRGIEFEHNGDKKPSPLVSIQVSPKMVYDPSGKTWKQRAIDAESS